MLSYHAAQQKRITETRSTSGLNLLFPFLFPIFHKHRPRQAMETAHSTTNIPPTRHLSVGNEAWSFCLSSHLLASFLDNPSDFCSFSTCGRAFLPFRSQIWRVKVQHKNNERSDLVEAILSGRLPCLCALDLSHLYVNWKVRLFPLLSLVVAGQVPSLRDLRLRVWCIDNDAVPEMLQLIALPHLECLRVSICGYSGAEYSIRDAAKKYPRLTVYI